MTTDSNDRLSVGPLPRADQITADFSHLDPTLDACCRRDAEDSLKAQTKRAVLQSHDRVAAYERTRRGQHHDAASMQQQQQQQRNPHLVSVPLGSSSSSSMYFDGCRCSYDPTKDGGADYPALAELRLEGQRLGNDSRRRGNGADRAVSDDGDSDDELDAFMDGFGGGTGSANRSEDKDGHDDNASDDDDDDLLLMDGPVSDWERQRKQQMLQQLQSLEAARQHGYGGHRPMHPTRVLKVAGLSQSNFNSTANSRIPPASVVVHLYDPDSLASASLDLYLEQALALQYPGTVFLRSDGRITTKVERELLTQSANQSAGGANSHVGRALMQLLQEPDEAFPALLVVRSGHVINVACAFHRPSYNWIDPTTGRVIPSAVEEWLERSSAGHGDDSVLRRQPPSVAEICHLRPEELALLDYLRTSNSNSDNDDGRARNEFLSALECNSRANGDDSEYYDCGLPGCRKPYHHQHVGIGGGGGGSNDENTNLATGGLPLALLDDDGAAASSSLSTDK
jgi:hypothetical protein